MNPLTALRILDAWQYGQEIGPPDENPRLVTRPEAQSAARYLRQIPGAPSHCTWSSLATWCRADGWQSILDHKYGGDNTIAE